MSVCIGDGVNNFPLLCPQFMIQCADVSHPARILRLHERWSVLISEEYYLQVG